MKHLSAAEIVRVQIEGRDTIGRVVRRYEIDGQTYVDADFGTFAVSGPAHIFTIVRDA